MREIPHLGADLKILRWTISAILVACALFSAWPLAFTIGLKAGVMSALPSAARWIPVAAATEWWQVALGVGVTGLYVYSAWRVVGARPALLAFIVTLALALANWAALAVMPAYERVFSQSERQTDVIVFAILILVALAIWWIDGAKSQTSTALTRAPHQSTALTSAPQRPLRRRALPPRAGKV